MTIIDFLNDYFDQTYILTLKRVKDRQQLISERLAGLNFEFFYGIDKQDLDLKTLIDNGEYDDEQAQSVKRKPSPMAMGEIACSMSHRAIYQDMIQKDYNRVLILEDDVYFTDQYDSSYLEKISAELPKDWGLLYFGYHKNEEYGLKQYFKSQTYKVLSAAGMHKWSIQRIKNTYPRDFSDTLKSAGNHEGAYGYAISKEAAQLLVEAQTPIIRNSDHLLSYIAVHEQTKSFITKEKLILHDDNLQSVRAHA